MNFIVKLDVYPFDVMVSIAQTDAELGKNLDIYEGLTEQEINDCRYPSDRTRGRYVPFSTGCYLIRLRNIPVTPEDRGTLAHEVMHVVCTLLEEIGMELKDGVSAEAYCYLTGCLTRNIYSGIANHKKAKSKRKP